MLKTVLKRTGEAPEVYEIKGRTKNRLREFQAICGSPICMLPVPYNKNLMFVVDDEGKFRGKPNCFASEWNDIIYGDFLVIADNGRGGERSLTKTEIEQTLKWLNINFERMQKFQKLIKMITINEEFKKGGKGMKIKEITHQYRRDFTAVYECEGCGNKEEGRGYDDVHFHQNVIPNMRCSKCGKTGAECGADYRPLKTKYPEGFQI